MRVRTEARRRAILDAARSVFEEQGFERATMSAISERLGGSKATLYGYFPSKEDLFVACVEEDIQEESGEILEAAHAAPDIRAALEMVGHEYLKRATGARPIAIYRMLAGQPPESRIGLSFYERGPHQAWMKLSIFLSEQMALGRLRRANGWVAAMHFKGLLEGEWVERRIISAMPYDLDAKIIDRTVGDAVDVFLRAYGPEAAAEVARKSA